MELSPKMAQVQLEKKESSLPPCRYGNDFNLKLDLDCFFKLHLGICSPYSVGWNFPKCNLKLVYIKYIRAISMKNPPPLLSNVD